MKTLTLEIDLTHLESNGYYDDEGDWCGSGRSVHEILTNEVKNQVVQKLSDELHKNTFEKVEEKACEEIMTSGCIDKMKERISKHIEVGDIKIKERYGDPETLDNFIARKMEEVLKDSMWADFMRERVTKAFKGLQDRYDAEFAIGIITKLKENNMLNESAMSLLGANVKPDAPEPMKAPEAPKPPAKRRKKV